MSISGFITEKPIKPEEFIKISFKILIFGPPEPSPVSLTQIQFNPNPV